jgi:glucose-6-phosphate-specific signal transduction histidine kinase
MLNRNRAYWIKAMAIIGLLLMASIVVHVTEAVHHADHKNCPLCLSLTGLIIVATFDLILYVTILLFQTRFQALSAVSVDVDCPRKRGPPAAIIL